MKIAGSTPEPVAPAEPAPSDDLDFGTDMDTDMGAEPSTDDKPFDDEPFDAGVEADEESDPKKFIEQLTGKLGQSLRKYNEEQGQPDFELEKFAINSLLSATHTAKMDAEDQKDIISKVKTAGKGDEDVAPQSDEDMPSDEDMSSDEPSDEEGLDEYRVFENMDNLFVNPKKNNMFQEGSNDILDESDRCTRIAKRKYDVWPSAYASGAVVKCRQGKIWKDIKEEDLGKLGDYKNMTDEQIDEAAKKTDFSKEKKSGLHGWFSRRGGEGSQGWVDCNTCRDGKCKPCGRKEGEKRSKYPSCRPTPGACKSKGRGKSWGKKSANESEYNVYEFLENMEESNNYMFWQNLKSINDNAAEILGMDMSEVDALLSDGHSWAVEHVITSKDDVEEVYHFLEYNMESKPSMMSENNESNNYMFFASLKTILHASSELLEMDEDMVDSILSDGHGWALDHIATAADDMEEVYHFLANTLNAYDGDTDAGYEDEFGNVEAYNLNEAEYQGRTVKLGKPMKGDVKKFKVFVKNKKGKVIKVNFGDPNMEIKRDNPKRRKSFRARHKCAQAKDRTKPKYWSCKMWSKKPVSKMVSENKEKNEEMVKKAHAEITRIKGKDYAPTAHEIQAWIDKQQKTTNENLQNLGKISIFDKKFLKNKLQESFNQDDTMNQPTTEPTPVITPTKPAEKPVIKPSRRDKPFITPDVEPVPPKAVKEDMISSSGYKIYHKTLSEVFDEIEKFVIKRGYEPIEFSLSDAQHVSYETYAKYQKDLFKNGKEQRVKLHAQVYRMPSGNYELNMYIS